MSELLDCDPDRGFVAFPVALFDLDLTPGAFRTLAELCRMANISGQCWPSLAQLGRRLGRSRASVSAYIAELREAGVLSTEEQQMANGYNYRLRYTVTFWQEWRAALGREKRPPARADRDQKPERRVQRAERPLRTKNHNHINHCAVKECSRLVSDWKKSVGRAPYPAFSEWPAQELLEKTAKAIEAPEMTAAIISADIESALIKFGAKHRLEGDAKSLADALVGSLWAVSDLANLIAQLDAEWKSHWRNFPSQAQMTRVLEKLSLESSERAERKLLKSYIQRWKLHQRSLLPAAIPSKVAA